MGILRYDWSYGPHEIINSGSTILTTYIEPSTSPIRLVPNYFQAVNGRVQFLTYEVKRA